jgi:16S rRNA (cytosine967-C5)-methyltransferase
LAGDLGPGDAAKRLPWVDWPRVRSLPEGIGDGLDDAGRIAVRSNLPRPVVERLRFAYGESAAQIAEGLCGVAPLYLRTNPRVGDPESIRSQLLAEGVETRRVDWSSGALEVIGRPALFRTQAHRSGAFEVQDAASQLVADLVAPPADGRVMDACAGAGGKTVALLGRWPSIELLAVDLDRERLATLGRRVRRGGHRMPKVLRVPADRWPADVDAFACSADRILIDAPCSGMGSLRRHPELRDRWTEAGHQKTLQAQRDLIGRAVRSLRVGARVVYATCSVLRDENEEQVEAALGADGSLEVVPAIDVLGPGAQQALTEDGRFLRTWPHRHGADGFFAAVLTRRA